MSDDVQPTIISVNDAGDAPSSEGAPVTVRTPAEPIAAHQPMPSETLMRQAVKQPATTAKPVIRAQGSTDSAVSDNGINAPLINQLPLKKNPLTITPLESSDQVKQVAASKPIASTPPPTSPWAGPSQPMPEPDKPSQPPVFNPPSEPVSVSTPRTSSDVMTKALDQTTAPVEPSTPVSFVKPNKMFTTAATAAVVLIAAAGISIASNWTNLRLDYASAKVGFNVKMPGSQPSGYSLSQLNYTAGNVSALYSSNSNSAAYTVSEKASNWDDQQLVANFVSPTDPGYQAVPSNGVTVYIYGDRNATWLKNGLWYIINSNGSMSDNQLVQMASAS